MHYPGAPATSLSVTVHSGRELPSTDAIGKGDPFVKLLLGGKEQKTTVKKGSSPVWEQTFTFNYSNEPSLRFQIWDKDLLSSDFMAVHEFSLLPILQGPARRFEGEVALTKKKGKDGGYLRITLEFYPKGDASPQPSSPPSPMPGQQGFQQPPAGVVYPPHQQVIQAQHPGYGVPAAGYPPQQAYGYAPQPGFPPQQGYPAQPGYPPQQAYPPQQPGFPPPGSYGQAPGYPPQPGQYPPAGFYPPQGGYPPQQRPY